MSARHWFRHFAVRGVFWRRYLDFGQTDVPFYLRTIMMVTWTTVFFFFAAPARRALLRNLAVILPGSHRLTNYGRAWLTLFNFAWTISDAADHKLVRTEFAYTVEGAENLERLAAARGAILLTAHMGSYDLGAALFADRYRREIRMVRAPEADESTARHVDSSLAQATAGAVKIAYNTAGMALPFELLNALRAGEIVSLLGDRATAGISQRETRLFGEVVRLPDGPFTLALVAQAPIYPVFILRTSFHHYKIIAGDPFYCRRTEASRDTAINEALATWCRKLEDVIRPNWEQWFSLVPIFPGMKAEVGYWFALPRLCARLAGRKVRRAEWSGWEAYGLGGLVFGIGCVFLARALCAFVRPGLGRVLWLLLTPLLVWIACLLVYFVNWLLAGLLRRFGLYRARTNIALQSFLIIALVSLLAALLLRDESGWLRSLGVFWLALVSLNLAAELLEKIR